MEVAVTHQNGQTRGHLRSLQESGRTGCLYYRESSVANRRRVYYGFDESSEVRCERNYLTRLWLVLAGRDGTSVGKW